MRGRWIDFSLIVPTLGVGMHPVTLRVTAVKRTQSVQGGIPTQSVGTIYGERSLE